LLELTQQESHKEHVTSYFYDNSDKFCIKNIFSNNIAYNEAHLAVDTLNDLKRINWVLETFGEELDLSLLAEKSNLWNSE
jgi:spore coat polysaccharide biosynthesis protein SpsF (cytidylyltransferase family)